MIGLLLLFVLNVSLSAAIGPVQRARYIRGWGPGWGRWRGRPAPPPRYRRAP